MKNIRKFYRIALLVICLTFVASMIAAALPQPAQAAPKTDPKLTFSARIDKGKVYITISPYHEKAKFQVKLRDAVTAKKWTNAGTIRLAKNTQQSFVHQLPKALAKQLYIQVCLKNQKTDKLNCKIVLNPMN